MPGYCCTTPLLNNRKFKLLALILFLPFFISAQSLTGLWIGTISNDSTTIRKDQSFEIALTEYRGKVYGYSRSEFIVDDVLYYIVKRVKGTIEGNICDVTDDEIVSYNFPKKLDKHVKVTSTFRRSANDSLWKLDGEWKTTATKKYYSITGKVDLEEEKDLTASKIFPHLEELKLAETLVFYKERKQGQPIVKIAKPVSVYSGYNITTNSTINNSSTASLTEKPGIGKISVMPVNNEPTHAESAQSIAATKQQLSVDSSSIIGTTKQTSPENTTAGSGEKNTNSNTAGSQGIVKQATEPKNIADNNIVKTLPQTNAQVTNKEVKPEKNTDPANKQVITGKPNNDDQEKLAKNSSKTEAAISKNINTPVSDNPLQNKQAGAVTTSTTSNDNVKKQAATVTTSTASNDNVKKQPAPTTINSNVVSANTQTTKSKEEISTVSTDKKIVRQDSNLVQHTMTPAPVKAEIVKPALDVTLKAAMIAGRKSEFSQEVIFKSDSLQVALYDNGEIDGDTVSVYMNGEVILSKQGLKSSAIRKTIYLRPGVDDEFTLVLFAENLGKYPPNTGLLVVRDGNDVYNLRFSSDFQKNAGIVFKRKKP